MSRDGRGRALGRIRAGARDSVVLAVQWRDREWLLEPGAGLTIGRAEESDVMIDSESVSRAHARITTEAGRSVIEDLGSKHGVVVNGLKILAPVQLMRGDRVAIGDAILVVVRPSRTEASGEQRKTELERPSRPVPVTGGSHDVLGVFASAARSALARGAVREAEVAARHLHDSLLQRPDPPPVLRVAAEAAAVLVELATATAEPEWLDRAFAVLLEFEVPLDATALRALARIAADLAVPPDETRHAYIAWHRSRAPDPDARAAIDALATAGTR